MSTLLLRLAAPLQSWGVESKFERRLTSRTPSKSGVIGICAAAFGYKRNDVVNLGKFANLKFGVRIDRPGSLLKDFHMAHDEVFWNPEDRSKINQTLTQINKNKTSFLTTRYYLADAAFLAGLEGEDGFLSEIDKAIKEPMYPLFLGRRSCPPEGRVSLGIVPDCLVDALSKQPYVVSQPRKYSGFSYKPRIVVDAEAYAIENEVIHNKGYRLCDVPLSFNPEYRKFNYRNVYEFDAEEPDNCLLNDYHDAFTEVEEVQPCI